MSARGVICFERVDEERQFFRDYRASYDEGDFAVSVFRDGITTKGDCGLIMTSVPFTQIHSLAADIASADYFKLVNVYNESFTVTGMEMVFEAVMGAEQHFDTKKPIPSIFVPRIDNMMSDYRLCSSAMLVRDKNNGGLTFGFLLTNDRIYVYYGRERRPCQDNEAHFTCVIPVVTRGLGSDGVILTSTYRLGIGLSALKQKITWYVDDESVFQITRPGHRLEEKYRVLEGGGDDTLIMIPRHVEFGFAHMTFLDHQLAPHRIVRSDGLRRSGTGLVRLSKETDYYEIYPDYRGVHDPVDSKISFAASHRRDNLRIFGQGMTTLICQASVVIRRRDVVPYEGESSLEDSSVSQTGYYHYPCQHFHAQ